MAASCCGDAKEAQNDLHLLYSVFQCPLYNNR